jgi:hypothetical protein
VSTISTTGAFKVGDAGTSEKRAFLPKYLFSSPCYIPPLFSCHFPYRIRLHDILFPIPHTNVGFRIIEPSIIRYAPAVKEPDVSLAIGYFISGSTDSSVGIPFKEPFTPRTLISIDIPGFSV